MAASGKGASAMIMGAGSGLLISVDILAISCWIRVRLSRFERVGTLVNRISLALSFEVNARSQALIRTSGPLRHCQANTLTATQVGVRRISRGGVLSL